MGDALQSEGKAWEERAASFLIAQGMTIIERNFCCPLGELDLIATHGNQLVFVEVRKRARSRFSSASGSINHRKQLRLQRAAEYFLRSRPRWRHYACRFDVVAWDTVAGTPTYPQWLRNAMPGF